MQRLVRTPASLPIVTLARRRLLVTMLALVAVLGAFGINGWHASMAHHHDDEVAVALMVEHGKPRPAPASDLHQAAHNLVGGWTDEAPLSAISDVIVDGSRDWTPGIQAARLGQGSTTELRPPRA